MKRPPRDFDLSTSPMPGRYYVPPKARSPQEIARRQALIPGELRLEQQHKGLRVARLALNELTESESLEFALPLISLSALNSVWHLHAESERTVEEGRRRRRLKYPTMKDWQDSSHMLSGLKRSLAQGETLAARLVLLHGTESKEQERTEQDFATCVGAAALTGAVVAALGDGPIPGTEYRAQLFARTCGLALIESRAEVAERLGTAPTLAQMADYDSDESVWWRRKAPDQARASYIQAQSDTLIEI